METASMLHSIARRNPDDMSGLGMFPPEEVEAWATDWHANYTATGGFHKGSPIVDTDAALAAFLRRCAANQSKRFRQVNRLGPIDPDAVAMPSSFGND